MESRLAQQLAEIDALAMGNLDRDLLVDPGVAREEDGAEAAGAEVGENLVLTHRLAEQEPEGAADDVRNAAFRVGDLGDTMKTVEEILNKRYETSAGKARVAKDMVDMDMVTEKENERKALEQNALAEFLASQGIQAAAPAQTETPAAAKEIGPERPGGS